jgi:16S rRNA (cytidine1402-2'-O)-methyltransferase
MSEQKGVKASQPAGRVRSRTYSLAGRELEARTLTPGLYLVATPIGNLGDVTLRALETLAGADLIACEDTRVTHKLLERYGISAPLLAYHDHNAASARPKVLGRLADGAAVALVSDAGTPLISDPGYKLVRAAQAAGFSVTAIPGASSVLAALAAAGLPTDRFLFDGFLPAKPTARRARMTELAQIDATLVLFETGARITDALSDLVAAGLGRRDAAICRELTKLHEQTHRGELAQLADLYAKGAETRGEFVVVIAPPTPETSQTPTQDVDDLLRRALGAASLKDAVSAVAEATGQSRREIYRRALALTKIRDDATD